MIMRPSPPSLLHLILAYPFLSTTPCGGSTTKLLASAGSWRSQRSGTSRCFSGETGFLFPTNTAFFTRPRPTRTHEALFSTHYPLMGRQYVVNRLFSTRSHNCYSSDILTSTSSNTVKRFVGLQKPKKRRETGETVVEGPRMVLDLLKNPVTRPLVQQIVMATDIDDEIREELDHILQRNDEYSLEDDLLVQSAVPNVVKACCDTVTPQGIVARVQIPLWDVEEISQTKQQQQQQQQQPNQAPLYLVLDGVSDPGNLGTLLRSSVAVGVTAVLLLPGSCDVWNPKAIRSAMGASFLVPTFAHSSWEGMLNQLEDWDCHQVWAATMLVEDSSGKVVSLAHYDIDWNAQAHALVIGNEGNGLSQPIRESLGGAVQAVHVPMQGTIESLNAAVCGSVILFEYMRQWQQ